MKYLIVLLFLYAANSFGQNASFDSTVTKGIKEIYNIKFSEAEKTFRNLIAEYPDHPAGRFFLAMIDWWKILLDLENESYDDLFFQKLEDVIYQCDKILEKNPKNVDALFFKGGSIGFRGRLRSLRESWLKAADDGREALPIVEEAAALDPNNKDVLLGFGIYNYYAAVIPNEFPMIKPLMIFFPEGNKELGIQQLKSTANDGKYAKYEARYFLMTLYYRYENNYKEAKKYARILSDDFPNNPVFERWSGRLAFRLANYSESDSIFNDVIKKAATGKYGYNTAIVLREAHYYIGYVQRQNGKIDEARKSFESSLGYSQKVDKDEESGFQVNSVLYLAEIAEAQKRMKEAIDLYEKLLDMRDYSNSHLIAEANLKRLKSN